jgi:hypothetical protein
VETRVRIPVGTIPLQVSRRRAPPPGLRSGSPTRRRDVISSPARAPLA